jgi:hypothetical protein
MILRTTLVFCLLLVVSTTLSAGSLTLGSDTWNVQNGIVTSAPVTVTSNISLWNWTASNQGNPYAWMTPAKDATAIGGLATMLGTDEGTLEGLIGGPLGVGSTAADYMSFGAHSGAFTLDFGAAFVSSDGGNNSDTVFLAYTDALGLHVNALVCDDGCSYNVDPADPSLLQGPLGVLGWTNFSFSLTDVTAMAIGVTGTITDPTDLSAVSSLFVAADASGSLGAPEPATTLSLGAGLLAVGLLRRRARS